MKGIFTKIALFAALSAIALSITGCSNKEEVRGQKEVKTVKIGYLPITHALPLYVENELSAQNFKNTKVELVKFGSWPELMDALNTGKIDGASVLAELAMKAKEQGIGLKAVALGHRDGNVAVVANDITDVNGLKGKNFAIPHKLSTHNILLYRMLKENGISYKDVNIVELPPPEMPAALSEGRISGYIVAEPFGASAVESGKGKVLYESQELWKDSVCCALVLRDDFIKNNPEAATEFVREYVISGEKAEAKDSKIMDIAAKYMKVDPKVLEMSLKWTSYEDLRLEEKDYNELVKYMQEMGLSEKPPEYSEFVDNSLIDKVE